MPADTTRPICQSLNGKGEPCRRPAIKTDTYCKKHRRCEVCHNRCQRNARRCRNCIAAGHPTPEKTPPNPSDAAQARAKARQAALRAGRDPHHEYISRPM